MPGLKFYKLDLHTHTPASKCYLDKTHKPEQIIRAALDMGLAAIAITDHNSAEWIDVMVQAGKDKGLVIFPGVEISLEQCHLVALFDPSVNQKHVENFLGAIDITANDYGKSDAVCTKSIYEVIDKIHERGGLAILAHIDQPKGIFYENVKTKDGSKINVPVALSKLLNQARYDAVECANGRLPDGFDTEHQIKRIPAVYQASDNPDAEKPTKHSCDGIGNSYAYFKLDEINLEGLRQCFVDSEPEVRIWLMDGYQETSYPKIVSLRVGGSGFLRNQCFEFHQGLNSLIGGQGVGKSLAIEFLRFGLAQPTPDPKLFEDHCGKLSTRLEQNNSVQITYQLEDGALYQIDRTFLGLQKGENGPVVHSDVKCINLATGEEYLGDIPKMFSILSYSQTEVIKIAENKNAQLELIDKFIDTRPYEQEIAALQAQLRENDVQQDKALQAKGKLDTCQREIDTIQAQIDIINKALANPLFDKIKIYEHKKAAFEERIQFVNSLMDMGSAWRKQVQFTFLDELPQLFEQDQILLDQQETARQAQKLILAYISELIGESDEAESNGKVGKLGELSAQIQAAMDNWIPEYEQVSVDYNKLLGEIGGDQEDKEKERKRLEKRKNNLEKDGREHKLAIEGLQGLWVKRDTLLDRLENTHELYYQERQRKFEQLNLLSDDKLNLVLEHAANRSRYIELLQEMLRGGQNSPTVSDRRKIAQNIMPRRLLDLVIKKDYRQLASEADIGELWAERVIEKFWSQDDFTQVLALQHNCFPEDVPTINFRKEGGVYAELSELSVGQKCTALLIIALCDGAMPVVIDQPEDALDLTSVWNDIAKKLRRGKNSRQFIITTHNSSVAVGADSDQFIFLDAGARYGQIVVSGAIDRPEVKSVVLNNLEGGPEPYKLRSRKYNLTQ